MGKFAWRGKPREEQEGTVPGDLLGVREIPAINTPFWKRRLPPAWAVEAKNRTSSGHAEKKRRNAWGEPLKL